MNRNRTLTNWMLDSYAVNGAIAEAAASTDRVEVEDVPSSREFLPTVLSAIQASKMVTFTYAGFSRSRPEKDILFAPYFLKRYKQRWYMLGYKAKSKDIRTYALDRVRAMVITGPSFTLPENESSDKYFGHILGVTTSKAPIRRILLKATPTQAKYFRALPLHSSQEEVEIHDDYSIFSYHLQLNYELVHELLAFGDSVTVIAPAELRLMVIDALRATLANYDS